MTEQSNDDEKEPTKPAPVSFADFLEGVQPSRMQGVTDALIPVKNQNDRFEVHTPQIFIHCSSDACNGSRYFRRMGNAPDLYSSQPANIFLTYICSNCRSETKSFSLHLEPKASGSREAQCYKYGELPAFGPPTPARLIRLFGGDKDIFLKGRRCEVQGLGVGAFTYYRRVVENQKTRIFDEIIRVLQAIDAQSPMIETLKRAKDETQFTKALESVKDAIPQSLLINGHNPIMLLHRALSVGVHQQTDEKCLELAHDIRVVLAELAERLSQALKDEAELGAAVSRLMNPKK
ncbi:MAG: hypothetical protein KIT15_11445 [Xanthobacteraceae bacterium]|nr:hypothetical protein [Xanthobacteraceae bacterium]MCW5675181.1 hypothetical protein [Xanthobacteraceae bacterium]MCW5676779.1 hypothetical protein [Xanthobacteraceae bacterium]